MRKFDIGIENFHKSHNFFLPFDKSGSGFHGFVRKCVITEFTGYFSVKVNVGNGFTFRLNDYPDLSSDFSDIASEFNSPTLSITAGLVYAFTRLGVRRITSLRSGVGVTTPKHPARIIVVARISITRNDFVFVIVHSPSVTAKS